MLQVDAIEIILISRRFEHRVVWVFFPGAFGVVGACEAKGHPALAGVFSAVIVGAA